MSDGSKMVAKYAIPTGRVGLKGPVAKPAPGTLPLRGDLAHIALADTHLAAHYVIPEVRNVNGSGADLRLHPRDDSEVPHRLDAGSDVEVLDVAGDWIWVTVGPEGPSGYVRSSELA